MKLEPKTNSLVKSYLLYGAALIFAITIIAKIIITQTSEEGAYLRGLGEEKEYRTKVLEASRGNILSHDGRPMATSIPVYDIYFDTKVVDIDTFRNNVDNLSLRLSEMFNKKTSKQWKEDLVKAKNEEKRYFPIAKGVSHDELHQLQTLPIFNKGRNRGGFIEVKKNHRVRPYNELAGRIIGYVKEGEGQSENIYVGLEGTYNDYLKGQNGQQLTRRLHHGGWIPVSSENDVEAKNGNDVVTTFDVNLQDIVESALNNTMITNKAEQGCAILMDVETGYIRACANLKLNHKTGKYEESYNFALAERYEPGSVFKIASMAVLFNQNPKIRLTDTVNIGTGPIVFSKRVMRDDHSFAKNGRASVSQIIEQSSNKGTAVLITRQFMAHPEKYVDGLYALGLNKKPGTGIAGEAQPLIKHPTDTDRKGNKLWSNVSLPWMSIGYEVNVTPMQIITLYNAIANNGKMMKPQFVSEIRHGNQTIERFDPVVMNEQICPPEGVKMLQSMLEGVVLRGTAKRQMEGSNVSMAGKTGTAQYCHPHLGYAYRDPQTGRREYNTTFVGYFPADKPKYSCIIVVSRAHGQFWAAGSVSAPGFREIAEKVYAMRLGVEEDSTQNNYQLPQVEHPILIHSSEASDFLAGLGTDYTDYNTNGSEWVTVKRNDNGEARIDAAEIKENTIPDVIGMNITDALYLLESRGINTIFTGEGIVIGQSLHAGDTIKANRTMELKLARK